MSKPVLVATNPWARGDAFYWSCVERADELDGCTEGCSEEAEYAALVAAIETYQEHRWPGGKIQGGKG